MACLCLRNAIDQLSHYKFDKRLELLRRLILSIDNFQWFDRRKRSPHEILYSESMKFWDFFPFCMKSLDSTVLNIERKPNVWKSICN